MREKIAECITKLKPILKREGGGERGEGRGERGEGRGERGERREEGGGGGGGGESQTDAKYCWYKHGHDMVVVQAMGGALLANYEP